MCYLITPIHSNTMYLPYSRLAYALKRDNSWEKFLVYSRSRIQRENNIQRIKFIQACKNADIIPRFLRFRIPTNGCFEPTVGLNFQRKLLNQELKRAKDALANHEHNHARKRKELQNCLPEHLFSSVLFYTRSSLRKVRSEVVSRHQKKLKQLAIEQERPLFEVYDTVKLHEVDIVPPRYVLDTLALGPKNSVLDRFDPHTVLADLDTLLRSCKRNKVSRACINDINIMVVKYIKICSKQRPPRHLNLTQKFLKKHDLLAVPFDKGNGFCVMKADDYQKKLQAILDLPQFEKVITTRKNAKDCVIKEEERVTTMLTEFHREGKIDDELLNKLKPIGSQPPRLHGLAKVHKNGVPVRPVLSMPGSPYHKIAQEVADWLSIVPEAQINSSSKKVCDNISTVNLDEDEVVISFDVSSLYTNVPVQESIQLAADRLYSGDFQLPPVDKDTFVQLANYHHSTSSCPPMMVTICKKMV